MHRGRLGRPRPGGHRAPHRGTGRPGRAAPQRRPPVLPHRRQPDQPGRRTAGGGAALFGRSRSLRVHARRPAPGEPCIRSHRPQARIHQRGPVQAALRQARRAGGLAVRRGGAALGLADPALVDRRRRPARALPGRRPGIAAAARRTDRRLLRGGRHAGRRRNDLRYHGRHRRHPPIHVVRDGTVRSGTRPQHPPRLPRRSPARSRLTRPHRPTRPGTTMLPTLTELQAALEKGETTSVDLTRAALARIADPGGEGARVFTAVWAEQALAAACASDTLRAAGQARSPLEGLPVSIKDLFDVAGQVTRAGSRVREDEAPARRHAEPVQRLARAGAVLIGHTNMTEFAFSGLGLNPHYGTPSSPWDRASRRIPGGSSSGAGVSVADGMAVAALGTDTGGSIRIPSAFCGLTGFKPTAARVPAKGAFPLASSLDSSGPLAASVNCCAIIDAILSGEDRPLPEVIPAPGLRLATTHSLVRDGMDAHVNATFIRTLGRLRDAGVVIDEIEIPEFLELAHIN